MLAYHYPELDRKEAYWGFVSRIDLIEELSGIRFHRIPEPLKHQWCKPGFFERKDARQIRDGDWGPGTPAGVLEGVTRDER